MEFFIHNLVNIIAIVGFLVVMFVTRGDKNKAYIQFLLLGFPFINFSIPITFGIALFDLITYLFLVFYIPKETNVKSGNLYLFLFLLIILASIVGCINAKSLEYLTLKAFIQLGSIFIFAKILIDECLEDTLFFHTVISCLKISLIVSFVFLIGQFIFGVKFSVSVEENHNLLREGVRYFSYFSDPQLYAQFLGAVSFLCLIKKEDALKMPLQNYLLFFLSLIAILLTGGRAGFGGWAVGLMIIILFSNSNYRFPVIIASVMLFFVLYSFADSLTIFKRSSLSESYDIRYLFWQEAFDIFKEHPLFGIGLGNYHNYIASHNSDQFLIVNDEIQYFNQPESGYLKFLTEVGLLGFMSIMLIILIPVFNAFKLFIKYQDISLLFLIASVASWMVSFYTVYSFADMRIHVLIITIICLLITSYKRILPDDAESI